MPVSLQLFSHFQLLQTVSPEVKQELSAQMMLREFPRRAVISAKDSIQSELGFLVEGRLQGVDFTVDGRSVGLYFVDVGDYFGELSVVDGLPTSEHIVAAVKSTVAFLEAKTARNLILSYPELSRAVMMRLAQRVRLVTAQRTLLSLPNPFQRLCVLLLQLPQMVDKGNTIIESPPTHQELAIMINASRETVTRSFQAMFANKMLVRSGNSLWMVDRGRIAEIAEGRHLPPKA